MGQQHGEALRDSINAFVAERLRAAKVYLYEHGSRDVDGLRTIAAQSMAIAASGIQRALQNTTALLLAPTSTPSICTLPAI